MPLFYDQTTHVPGNLDRDFIFRILRDTFGILHVKMTDLTGYEDKNFRLTEIEYDRRDGPSALILKISNPVEALSEGHFDFQSKVFDVMNANGVPAPKIFPTVDGRGFSLDEEVAPGVKLPIRLFHVIPGKILEEFDFIPEIIKKIGATLAKMHVILDNSKLSTVHIPYISAKNIQNLRQEAHYLEGENIITKDKLKIILEAFANYEDLIKRGILDEGIIHSDFNETNVLIQEEQITGVLDFGDAHLAPRAMDIGSLILYLHLSDRLKQGIAKLAENVLDGYRSAREFRDSDDSILVCMQARISCSLIYGLRTARRSGLSSGAYVLKTQGPGWTCLKELLSRRSLFE